MINQASVALWQLNARAEKERALGNVEATVGPKSEGPRSFLFIFFLNQTAEELLVSLIRVVSTDRWRLKSVNSGLRSRLKETKWEQ